jgi:adenylate cyclase
VAVQFKDLELANLIFGELLRARMRTSSALHRIVQALSPGAEIGAVIEDICRTTEQAMEAEQVLLFLRDSQRNILRARAQVAGRAEDLEIALGEGLVGKAAEADQLTNVPILSEHPHYRPEVDKCFQEQTRSVLCVPLSKEDGVSPGLLVIVNKRRGAFTREDEGLGMAVASQISVVLREARLFTHIRNMKNYYERILESIATGILTLDRLGKLTTVNRAGTEMFGLRPSADAGKDLATLFGGTTNARFATIARDALTQHRAHRAYDVRLQRADGFDLSLNLNAVPLEDSQGNYMGAVLVAEDISKEQRLMNTLCRYMAREVAEQVLRDKDEQRLGGTRTEVTILLTDVRNFTTISEQMDPWDVVNLLNAYLPRMINVIFRHQGMVDKFIGDAILAVFGIPALREDDALRAARAALEMRRQLLAINKERAREGQLTIEMGIGITSGTVISGNIGSERRMDYTVIGDPVNLAARLESLTKEVKRRILVSDRVREAISKEIPCEELGLFAVKGKREKVRVFAIKTPDEDSQPS